MSTPSSAALALHRRLITLDGHVDLPLGFGRPGQEADRDGEGQFDLAKVADGRLSAAVLTLFAGQTQRTAKNRAKARDDLETLYAAIAKMVADFPERAGLAFSPSDVARLKTKQRLAVILALQNLDPLEEDLGKLDAWIDRGVRMVGFTHYGHNAWAGSARPFVIYGDDPLTAKGLTPLGRQAVAHLNGRGVVIDISQLSTAAVDDVLAASQAPLIASHSALRRRVDLERNLSDDQLRAVAAGGGVAQIVAFSPLLKPFSAETLTAVNHIAARFGLNTPLDTAGVFALADPATATWSDDRLDDYRAELHAILDVTPRATLDDYLDVVEEAIALAGVDHVGFSSDFNQYGGVEGWAHAGQSPIVTEHLLRRGYSEIDIAKLWGGNFLRAWSAIQAHGQPAGGTHHVR